ncbi:MAG TPA: hypothetical protein VEL07_12590 [Planctomycetota bacterium]|nr:hypothetical protein [Planctomycetota bacterium]
MFASLPQVVSAAAAPRNLPPSTPAEWDALFESEVTARAYFALTVAAIWHGRTVAARQTAGIGAAAAWSAQDFQTRHTGTMGEIFVSLNSYLLYGYLAYGPFVFDKDVVYYFDGGQCRELTYGAFQQIVDGAGDHYLNNLSDLVADAFDPYVLGSDLGGDDPWSEHGPGEGGGQSAPVASVSASVDPLDQIWDYPWFDLGSGSGSGESGGEAGGDWGGDWGDDLGVDWGGDWVGDWGGDWGGDWAGDWGGDSGGGGGGGGWGGGGGGGGYGYECILLF